MIIANLRERIAGLRTELRRVARINRNARACAIDNPELRLLIKALAEDLAVWITKETARSPAYKGGAKAQRRKALGEPLRIGTELRYIQFDLGEKASVTWEELRAHLRDVTMEYGAKSALAKHVKVTRQAVSKWIAQTNGTEPSATKYLAILDWLRTRKTEIPMNTCGSDNKWSLR